MQSYVCQISVTVNLDAENPLSANEAVNAMIRSGFGPTLGAHSVQLYPSGSGMLLGGVAAVQGLRSAS